MLNDIELLIVLGEFLIVIGLSGCGKSMFLKLIVGFDIDYEGFVIINGCDVLGLGIW